MNVFVWKSLFASPTLKLTVLDVGQGNCALIEFPSGDNILVDAGPKNLYFDAGQSIVVPFLKDRGIKNLKRLILSHADDDHSGGAEYLVDNLSVREIYVGYSCPTLEYSKMKLRRAGDWEKFQGALFLYFNPLDSSNDDNDNSLCFTLWYEDKCLLFTGDIGFGVEKDLLRYKNLLDCDVLFVSHHGSKSATSEEFLKATSPEWAVISCGRNNIYRHPAPETLDRLSKFCVKVHRTDLEGAGYFIISQSGIEKIIWRE
jgi:competence protein ComEC